MEALMSFGIQGPKGDTGARGPQGATGPQGPAGASASGSGLIALVNVLDKIMLDTYYENTTLYNGKVNFALLVVSTRSDPTWVWRDVGSSYKTGTFTIQFSSTKISATGQIAGSSSTAPNYIFVY